MNNLGALLQQASSAHQANDLAQAKWLYEQIIDLDPFNLNAMHALGILAAQAGQLDEAIMWLENALVLRPGSAVLHNNLGAMSLRQNRPDQAVNYFKKALQLEPKHQEARSNLAATLLQQHQWKEAVWHYHLYLQLAPEDSEAHYNSGLALMQTGQLEKAIQHFKIALDFAPRHIDAHCNLAAVYLKTQQHARAIEAYERVLALDPHHPIAQYALSALTGKKTPTAAPPDYIKNLFDSYADYFDEHLIHNLRYQMPQRIHQALQPFLADIHETILDLGCGTGLCCTEFQSKSEKIRKRIFTGVDLSPRMLEEAKKKCCYDELIESDITNFLNQTKNNYDLIVACDTLVYFGDLAPVFSGVRAVLNEHGLFTFSVELTGATSQQPGASKGYALQTTGRYQHDEPYIVALARQYTFQVLHSETLAGRQQAGQPVRSGLFILAPV